MPGDFKPGALKLELQRLSVLNMPRREYLTFADFDVARVGRLLGSVQAQRPRDFAELLSLQGVGAKTARAMALITDIVYGAPASFRDTATYSFAHGGKDGHPFPVNRALYDTSIRLFSDGVHRAKVAAQEKREALARLHSAVGGATKHGRQRFAGKLSMLAERSKGYRP